MTKEQIESAIKTVSSGSQAAISQRDGDEATLNRGALGLLTLAVFEVAWQLAAMNERNSAGDDARCRSCGQKLGAQHAGNCDFFGEVRPESCQ